ncbi:MAG TPA: ABC transporter permease subunit [Thermoleophilia bacterium]|nr:ABC transporter permease subunit [Thermoleophilia bacterium]
MNGGIVSDEAAIGGAAARGGVAIPEWPVRLGALIGHQLRSRMRSTIVWSLSLGLLGTLYVALFPTMKGQLDQYMSALPEEYLAFLGLGTSSMSTLAGFLSIEMHSIIAPLALAFLPIIMGARAIAGAEETKSLDVLLSNPLPRWMIVACAFLTMVVELGIIVLALALLILVPTLMVGESLSVANLFAGSLNLIPFCLFFGGLALLFSAAFRRPGLAIAIPGAVLVASYVLDGLAAAIDAIAGLRPLSIFYHYGSAIETGMPWGSAAVITLFAVAFAGSAMALFYRRDIYT